MIYHAWTLPPNNSPFRLQRIIDGEFDDDLRAWGESAAAFGDPLKHLVDNDQIVDAG